jgi:hypothetical protein
MKTMTSRFIYFDYGELFVDATINTNVGIDIDITPTLMDSFPMSVYADTNGI